MLPPYPVPADSPLTVLVVGATGQQGGATARHLLARGHRVRALTRNAATPKAASLLQFGAEVVEGDLEDVDSLRRALRGVDSAYLMATPYERGVDAEEREAFNFLEAAKGEEIPHLCYSSVASADEHTGIPHFDSKARVEERLLALNLPHTIIAPVWFMENFSTLYGTDLARGRLAMPLPPDTPLQMVAVEDIGAFATLVIENRDRFLGKRIELAGDELTGEETAKSLTRALGKPVRYEESSLDEVRRQSADLAEMFSWFARTGYSVDIEGLRRDYPEVGWQRFDAWAERMDWSRVLKPATPQR